MSIQLLGDFSCGGTRAQEYRVCHVLLPLPSLFCDNILGPYIHWHSLVNEYMTEFDMVGLKN